MIDGGLRGLFRKNLPSIHWVSVETGMTGRGVPDSNGCINGKEFWIEYKQTKHWRVAIRPEQVGWMMRRTRVGGRVFIAVRRANVELWLFDGAHAVTIVDKGLKECAGCAIGIWRGNQGSWDWEKIRGVLSA